MSRPGARQRIEPWLRNGSDEEILLVCATLYAETRGLELNTTVHYLLHAAHVGLVRLG